MGRLLMLECRMEGRRKRKILLKRQGGLDLELSHLPGQRALVAAEEIKDVGTNFMDVDEKRHGKRSLTILLKCLPSPQKFQDFARDDVVFFPH